MNEKLFENILIYDVSYIVLMGAKSWRIMFDKVNELIKANDKTKYFVLFSLENIMLFMIELDIL